ncbi:MAG TPA: asparagine synthase (glutamine-hydrolyzing) [Candidatus Angelobacter sp.]|nr:asparagine synthase (glutamine-hydrolyzing) [Candidatus Angelobacter sp.]
MCGFAGIVSERGVTAEGLFLLERATSALAHRGPDDEGYVLLGNGRARSLRGIDTIPELASLPPIDGTTPQNEVAAFGFRRLSIIELSVAGHMPMQDPATGNWLVFNGEIYNYRELRQELLALGHSFRSYSDTEVLLKAYAQWGAECVHRLNGMWAFALWDMREQKLFCSRDRFGEKQLYFRNSAAGDFWFASEIRPLLIAAGPADRVNAFLVWDFLMYGLADHTEETFFSGIRQLLPGTSLFLTPGRAPEISQYYNLKPKTLPKNQTPEQLAEGLRQRLHESVRLRLRSDVPVASFFSGGLDSASIVSLADEIICSHEAAFVSSLRTYTNCYPAGHAFDESPRVRTALPRMRSVQPAFIQASEATLESGLIDLIETQEQPFHNVSIFASYNLLRLIRQRENIKVVLTGEAGDELLAGYQRVYLPLFMSGLLRQGHWITWAWELGSWGVRSGIKASGKGFFNHLPAHVRLSLQKKFNPVAQLMTADFFKTYEDHERTWVEQWRKGPLQHRLDADVTRFNLPQLLRHLDRNAMRFSIETRVPFLDPELVEYCAALPERMKLHSGYSKYALRRAMDGRLPDEIAWNRTKLGFGMAEQFWFRRCADLIEDNHELENFVDVKSLVASLRNSTTVDQSYWLPVCLGLWMKQFIQDSSRWELPAAHRGQVAIMSAKSGNGVTQ